MKPYRNDRIISALGALFFGGGHLSFASQYDHLFPRLDGTDPEVPKPMLALVATAVSLHSHKRSRSNNSIFQLFVSLYEWRTGEH